MTFSYWLCNKDQDCGLCDPPLPAQAALNFLCDYLLGDDWYISTPESTEQVNSVKVFEILNRYSPKFRREMRRYKKRTKKKKMRRKRYARYSLKS